MKNCHTDILAYHDEGVTLPNKERTEMRKRRDSNRRRLSHGLEHDSAPKPFACRSQGSYAMRTMVQQPDKDYDVDDGVYFDRERLKGPRGGDRSAAEVKAMVRDALHSDSFGQPPESLKNCVRVYYAAGYHVDVPVYRRTIEEDIWGNKNERIELASTNWKASNPLAVTEWLLNANEKRSPNRDNGGQLRRIVRLLKAFARSRQSWRTRIATGFMITALVVEHYSANADREDQALYDTMVAIRNRLNWNSEIPHPTVAGEMLTKGQDDGRTRILREKLDWAIGELDVLFEPYCTREQALKAWDRTFNATFFIDRLEVRKAESQRNNGTDMRTSILIDGNKAAATAKPVDKRGGGRYA